MEFDVGELEFLVDGDELVELTLFSADLDDVDLATDQSAKGIRSRLHRHLGEGGQVHVSHARCIAEMERDLTCERTNAALRIARGEGRVGGRKKVMTPATLEAARKLFSTG